MGDRPPRRALGALEASETPSELVDDVTGNGAHGVSESPHSASLSTPGGPRKGGEGSRLGVIDLLREKEVASTHDVAGARGRKERGVSFLTFHQPSLGPGRR
jgi:hypothetical protein